MEISTRTVPVPGLGIDFEVIEGDEHIGPAIAAGGWEEHETRLFNAHVKEGARVLDLGANIGWFAAQAVLRGATVDAFEPVPHIADVLERNVARAMERGSGTARVHRFAAGSETGSAEIFLAATNRGDNRVVDSGASAPRDMDGAAAVEIQIRKVDDLITGPVDVLKIDTQGSEWHALQGALDVLKASPRLALLIEFWPYALRGATGAELLELLMAEGFCVGKATAAPYPMSAARLLRQAESRDPVKGGLDLYATRGVPFHVGGAVDRLRSLWRSFKED
ncbi:MAG: FkbM family methyltransferase [Planctomycetes bacterium]|nr:FkbM family methyltransferase [Planctomycetota bacterium]